MPRRSRRQLEASVASALTDAERAIAHYELGLFHDNNGREREAIPHYERALVLGLPSEMQAACLAWLASSLFKTSRPHEALLRLQQSHEHEPDADLRTFLNGLERRIRRRSAGV